jgi:hypothetical protein
MTTATVFVDRDNRFGLAALRLAAAALFAVLVLGATIGLAGAATGKISVSQSEYVAICRSTGGTVFESPGFVVCKYPDGNLSVCNFDTMTCEDFYSFTPTRPSATHDGVGGGVVLDAGEASGEPPPTRTTRATTTSRVVLVPDDDTR